jgi:peroxiredoxin
MSRTTYEIIKAPEFNVKHWVDKNGESITPIQLADLKGKFKVLYCFQSWCPGCHSKGLPDLKKNGKCSRRAS